MQLLKTALSTQTQVLHHVTILLKTKLLRRDQSGILNFVLNGIHWNRIHWKLWPYPSLHATHRQTTPTLPCSLMLIPSVTFVWGSQMAFLPPPSSTPYLSPFTRSHNRPLHPPSSLVYHYYIFHPRLLAYGLKLTGCRGGYFKLKGRGRGLVCYGGAGGGFCRP